MRRKQLTVGAIGLVLLLAGVIAVVALRTPDVTGQPGNVSAADVARVLGSIDAADEDDRWTMLPQLLDLGPDAASHLVRLLEEGDFEPMTVIVGWRAVHAQGLKAIASDRLIRAVVDMTDIDARRAAADLLTQTCSSAHEGRLIAALDETFDPMIRIAIAKALWECCKETSRSLLTLRELMQSDMTATRLDAALAYAETGRIEPVALLLSQLAAEPSSRGLRARELLQQMRLQRTLERIMIGGAPTQNPDGGIVDPEVSTRIPDEVIQVIQERAAVDLSRITEDRLVEAGASFMLHALDPYASFLRNETEIERARRMVNFLDVEQPHPGLVLGRPGGIRVMAVAQGSPAEAAGLMPGDAITEVNGEGVAELSLVEVQHMLCGEAGTQVVVKVDRPGWFVQRRYRLQREVIEWAGVTSTMLPGRIGLIRVSVFDADTAGQIQATVAAMESARSLILDLRNNPGGSFEAAVRTAGLFLPAGSVVGWIEGRNPDVAERTDLTTGEEGPVTDRPLTVLIDRGTADAAEFLAGSLHTHGRARLVGDVRVHDAERYLEAEAEARAADEEEAGGSGPYFPVSFGKGIVQEIIPINFKVGATSSPESLNGCAVKLSVAYYHLPDGEIFHHKGLRPDVHVVHNRIPGWEQDEFERPAVAAALERWLGEQIASDRGTIERLAMGVGGTQPADWPGLADVLRTTGCRATPRAVTKTVRAMARAELLAVGAERRADAQDDLAIRRAVQSALESTGRRLADVDAYAGLDELPG